MGRTGGKVAKGSLGSALLKTQKKSSATNTADIASSAGKHVSARDGGDAAVALASYLEGSSLVRNDAEKLIAKASHALQPALAGGNRRQEADA